MMSTIEKNKTPKGWYRELPTDSTEDQTPVESSIHRREVLKLMSLGVLMSTVSCVRRPVQKIVPYVKRPPEIVPGVANYYTSTWVDGAEGFGFIVKTREGRPIKLEGNRAHPSNQGALSARAQAQVLGLYDPDRAKGPSKVGRKTESIKWEDADKQISAQLKKGNIRILTGTMASPSTNELINDFFKTYEGKAVTWDVIGSDDVKWAQEVCYKEKILPKYRFDRSRYTISVDADFLGTYLSPTEFSKQYSKAREPGKDMTKLVSFESVPTLTGANADVRYGIKPSQQATVVLGLLHEIVVKQNKSSFRNDTILRRVLLKFTTAPEQLGIDRKTFEKLGKELWENRGESLVIAGGLATQTRWSRELQVAVNLLNAVLENDGKTIEHNKSLPKTQMGSTEELAQLIEEMKSGQVKTLIVHNVNPVYSLPKSAGFIDALKNVEMVISTADRLDETAALANYLLPDHHHMENWGDSEIHSGVLSIQQPTIRPLYDTRAFQDSLIHWLKLNGDSKTWKKANNWYDYLRLQWKWRLGGGFEAGWHKALQDGVYTTKRFSDSRSSGRNFQKQAYQYLVKKPQNIAGEFELALYPTVGLGDGRYANLTWLQELPDPVTKVVWDSYLCISPKSAKKLDLKDGDIVEVTVGKSKLETPVLRQPGMNEKTIALAVGYGRSKAGRFGTAVGTNAFDLAQLNEGLLECAALGAKLRKTGKYKVLANSQGHHSMMDREIVAETSLIDFLKNPASGKPHAHTSSLWPKHEYKDYKWAMAIDLNKCTGCSACVIACQAENNIPNVGKEKFLKGREMHWIRLDRYYNGDAERSDNSIKTAFQPVTCQHCDNAPCETVCPVVATTHSGDGLNQMTYNRCVGTRYCSNNCPYKVRRFNWFNYAKYESPQEKVLNPDVTVRSRGVMEKCTFCVQRLHVAKGKAKNENRKVKDGEAVTACQQSCPADAIVFGNIKDETSKVAQFFKDPRAYALLEDLNAAPAARYLTKVRNTDETQEESGGHA
jgi:Fe-S-cluster-containing dehydrogenase component/anaerobic selenocysteine-containing dehydrogenase